MRLLSKLFFIIVTCFAGAAFASDTIYSGTIPATVFPNHGIHYNTQCQVQLNLQEDESRFFIKALSFQCASIPDWTESIRLYKKDGNLYDSTGTAQGFIHDTGTVQFEIPGQATYYLQRTKAGLNFIRDNSSIRMKGKIYPNSEIKFLGS